MESSEDDDDFPSIESITPQLKVESLFQSHTEKGIRQLCCELLDLKDAVENLCGNMRTKYLAFLRISEEVVEVKHGLTELQKHISSQGILVQDLMTGVCSQLDEWNKSDSGVREGEKEPWNPEYRDPLSNETKECKMLVLETIDILLAEQRIEEAVEAIIAEERNSAEIKGSSEALSAEANSYRSLFLERKAMVEEQLVQIVMQPLVSMLEMKKALLGLINIGKGPSAHQYFLKWYGSHLQKSIDGFLPSCSLYPRTFAATLAKVMFSAISMTTRESGSVFGDNPVYTNRIVRWAELQIEYLVRLVKENAPSETICALHSASICVQASLNYCSMLESQGLQLSKLLLVLIRPYIDEVLEFNFRRARRTVLDLEESDENLPVAPRFVSPFSAFATSSDHALIGSGLKFMYTIDEILEQLTPLAISHFGGNILSRISQLFDKYVDALNKALPGSSDDDSLTELKEVLPFRAETDSEQLALLGMAYTIADELLPDAIWSLWNLPKESKEPRSEQNETSVSSSPAKPAELKEWKRHLHHSFDKLRDHFCRQYVLSFIYSREGKTRLNAQIYLSGNGEDSYWDSDPLPSLPFQALFAKLQQFATVAGDVLVGKEKIQKNLLARLTETVVMWLKDEQEFWVVFEDESSAIQAMGLQQLILDMHFTVEIARFAGYPSRHVQQIASAIIARAIRTLSARGIDPQSWLPEDEWFVETAKSAISILLGPSGSDESENDEGHIIRDHILSDSDESGSSLSSVESAESFASASMGELESPMFTDPES